MSGLIVSSADSVKRSETLKHLRVTGDTVWDQTAAAVSEEITSHTEANIITTCQKK